MEENEEYITPEWLLKHGFITTTPGAKDVEGAWDLEHPFNEGDLCFIEKRFDRRQFAVIMMSRDFGDGTDGFLHAILVREDAGCGFVDIPHGFVEWPIYNFCLLYESIRGIKL